MKVVKIGLDITDEGLQFYGSEEVNDLLRDGARVISITPSQVFIQENPEEHTDESDSVTLSGWEMNVELDI